MTLTPTLFVSAVVAALLFGLALGILCAYLRAGQRTHQLRIELEAARVRLETTAAQEGERLALLEQSEARLRAAFDQLAGETLRANS